MAEQQQPHIPADIDLIVFQGRNKAYGAYVHRMKYPRNTTLGLIAAVVLFGLAVAMPTIIDVVGNLLGKDEEPVLTRQEVLESKVTELANAPLEREENKPPPPPKIEPPQIKQVKYVPPKAVEDDEAPTEEEELPDIEEVETSNIGFEDVEGEDILVENFEPAAPEVIQEPEPKQKEPDPFEAFTGDMPQAVNLDEVKGLIGYPDAARENQIQGMVNVRVLVNESGKYEKHIVIGKGTKREPHALLVNAVEQHITKLRFTPGVQAGRPVKVWVTIPFRFALR